MENYPRTILELEKEFSTESDCAKYLASLRWPKGFECPNCGKKKFWPMEKGLFMCVSCQRQTSVKAGTIYQDSRVPLPVWFRAAWWLVCQKNGCSAKGLQRVLGIGSYQTSWCILHKFRRAMVFKDRNRLSGLVEVDETYVGGERKGGPVGRGAEGKAVVIIAVEDKRAEGFGRIRAGVVADASGNSIGSFIRENVEPRSRIRSDGWTGYGNVGDSGYFHVSTAKDLKLVHRVAALLKRWLIGTHQGAIEHEHLQSYLNEFVFRFNRRTSGSRGLLFYRLMENSVKTPPATYGSISKGLRKKNRKHKIQ